MTAHTALRGNRWGEDTTWYLHDYDNWTNSQIGSAMAQDNYNMTVESWREQRSYIINAIGVLNADPHYAALGAAAGAALSKLSALTNPPDVPQGWVSHPVSGSRQFTCAAANNAVITFGDDGSIAQLGSSKTATLTGALARFIYQTISADNFTAFDNDYGNKGCGPTTENPGCHNFNKVSRHTWRPLEARVDSNHAAWL